MFRPFIYLFLLLSSAAVIPQNSAYSSFLIAPELRENANAVVREEIVDISIESIDKMRITTKKVITILNKQGDRYAFTGNYYSDNTKIKDQSLLIYDEHGTEIKKFKSRHFDDRSAIASGTLYSDTRISYVDFTPRDYPYTLVYESVVETGNTVFVNNWNPVKGFYISVEKSTYSVKNPANIELRFKERNLESLEVEKSYPENGISYSLTNFPAYKYEAMSPPLEDFEPELRVALNTFSLVGVEGSGSNWENFGKWQYDNLLAGRNTLSEATVHKIDRLTANAENNVEKAKIIYDYVQQNSRYVSVQLGIGGWEPIPAAEVDNLKYGDCKGLTNYTKALLDSQNIPSYYAVVYSGEEKRDIDAEFASMQGNHVILNLPQEEGEDIWLECTSQTLPFNYLGDFTDDRNVLLVKPEGGEIVKTKTYSVEDNLQESIVDIHLSENGSLEVNARITSSGVPYGNIYGLSRAKKEDQVLYYKSNWGHLKDVSFKNISFKNDREARQFTEELNFTAERFATKAGSRLLLPLNFFIPELYNVPRNETRTLPIQVSRGKSFKDRFQFFLPAGYEPESVPEDLSVENDFGSYQLSFSVKEQDGNNLIQVERKYVINEGIWPAESYSDFRGFMHLINTMSNQKAVIAVSN